MTTVSNNKMHADMAEAMPKLRRPSPALPAGAWDTHAHVFGPFDAFPLAQGSPYRPPLAPFEQYQEMLDRVGFAHGVLVHASANGYDNSTTLDALRRSAGRLRGIAVVPVGTPDAAWADLHRAGMRGLRFSAIPDGRPVPNGVLGFEELKQVAPRLRELGWVAQLFASADAVAQSASWLRTLGIPIVLDHMGLFDVARGVADPSFQTIITMARDGVAWIKTTPLRVSKAFPAMEDVRPFHAALVASAPDRLIWGSDWPFIGLGDQLPENARLVEILREWTADEAMFKRMLVDNPRRLFG
jgi:2-pyrone-4,6-dicarboxylate lactonase